MNQMEEVKATWRGRVAAAFDRYLDAVWLAGILAAVGLALLWIPVTRETLAQVGPLLGLVRNLTRWAGLFAGANAAVVLLFRHRQSLIAGLSRLFVRARSRPAPPAADGAASAPLPAASGRARPSGAKSGGLLLPVDLLGPPARMAVRTDPEAARLVVRSLQALGVPGVEPGRALSGPVVTLVEIRVPASVKASEVKRLAPDVAAQIGAQHVRISHQEGAPGVLRVEVTRSQAPRVPLRALVEHPRFPGHDGDLPILIGVNALGSPVVADLAELPHLLVGGSTGAGKSVALRQMLVSLICRQRPDQLGLILIDPKRTEFGLFRELPHLQRAVICDPEAAVETLAGLVTEMERRYGLLADTGAANITGYNRRVAREGNPPLPYLVAVVDELADLMDVAGDRVERSLKRLAQKARAAGIHLIVATQRPDTRTISGTIKAVLPARLALQLPSSADSMTILGHSGAERLRGKGDAIFKPNAEALRVQCAWVPEETVERVVAWCVSRCPTRGPGDAAPLAADSRGMEAKTGTEHTGMQEAWRNEAGGEGDSDEDDLLREVKRLVLQDGCTRAQEVARRLQVRVEKAVASLQELERQGWLSPGRGPKSRELLLSPEERCRILGEMNRQGPTCQ